ncbi:MAG: ATP-binding protein [Acidobacteriota bacterium]
MLAETQNGRDETILILAPAGRDGELAARFISEASLASNICESMEELCDEMVNGAGLVFLTREALTRDALDCVARAIATQPAWSDIPIILLTSGGGGESPNDSAALIAFGNAANVTLIERPVRVMTLLTSIEAALRARRRQYQVRDLLESEHEAVAAAEKANRLKDEFLATVSHELRNPLNVVLGYSEILLRTPQIGDSPSLRQMTEALKRNAQSQSQLINDLLDLSRLQMGKISLNRETVWLSAMIENAVETVRTEADGKNITIAINESNEALFVEADPLRLQQVTWNLLNNAVKFTPAGGQVNISLTTEDESAVLVIQDSGQGIQPDFLPHVFEMFRQGDASTVRRQSGLGIGLALVRRLVELHGGSVAADSKGTDQGASFTIRLPLKQQAELEPLPTSGIVKGRLAGMNVLMIDDSEDTIAMLKILLEIDGATVTSARNGGEALRIAAAANFDVILSDISMPEMDGFEFLRRLRQIPGRTDVPVLALTGFGQAEDIARADAAGFASHLTKPLEVDGLTEILQGLFEKNGKNRSADTPLG